MTNARPPLKKPDAHDASQEPQAGAALLNRGIKCRVGMLHLSATKLSGEDGYLVQARANRTCVVEFTPADKLQAALVKGLEGVGINPSGHLRAEPEKQGVWISNSVLAEIHMQSRGRPRLITQLCEGISAGLSKREHAAA